MRGWAGPAKSGGHGLPLLAPNAGSGYPDRQWISCFSVAPLHASADGRARRLTKLAEALDFPAEPPITRLDTVPPVGGKLSDDLVKSLAHLTSPSFRRLMQ